MSTSPSWFDQEKFSRLVKKVGPKNVPEPAPSTAVSEPPPPPPEAPKAATAPPPVTAAVVAAPVVTPPPDVTPSRSAEPPQPEAPLDAPASPETPAYAESLAPTARISLVSKPPSLLSENRALPALPRRTTPLPGLKSLFQYPPPTDKPVAAPAPVPAPPQPPAIVTPPPLPEAASTKSGPLSKPETKTASLPRLESPTASLPQPESQISAVPKPEAKAAPIAKPDLGQFKLPAAKPSEDQETADEGDAMAPTSDSLLEEDHLTGIWQKMALLNEELAQTSQERDHALNDINILRDQLKHADEVAARNNHSATPNEFAQVAKERDEALAELRSLKEKKDEPKFQLPDGVTKTKELVFLTEERDRARKEYADLRKQFESMKRDQTGQISNPREDSNKFRKELEQQVEGFRLKLEERNRELAALKASPAPASSVPSPSAGDSEAHDKFKAEISALQAQLAKAKEDTSIAQRGLALSQKALQETRDTLREATEGTSLSRHNFDNLKAECATLTQQNTVLQAQNEQLSREVASFKASKSGRLS